MGLRNGSPPAGSRGSAPVGLWGEAPYAKFILNHMHVIQQDKLKVGLFCKVEIATVILGYL